MKTVFTLVCIGFTLFAQAQTSKDSPKLQSALERFPQADANGDGVLTVKEAKTFKKKATMPVKKDGGGDGLTISYIYKTVGKYRSLQKSGQPLRIAHLRRRGSQLFQQGQVS